MDMIRHIVPYKMTCDCESQLSKRWSICEQLDFAVVMILVQVSVWNDKLNSGPQSYRDLYTSVDALNCIRCLISGCHP